MGLSLLPMVIPLVFICADTALGATIPQLTHVQDTHHPWQSGQVITAGRFTFEDGAVLVPTESGPSVELDRVALARLHQNYVNCGLTKRDDELEMQKVQPGWTFQSV